MIQTSHDIIKAYGGELKVETKGDEENLDSLGKGEGAEFIIQLPIVFYRNI